MPDTSNESFVELTTEVLVNKDPPPKSIAVRVCVHDALHTGDPEEGDVDLSLRYDPVALPLGPDAEWQSFDPLPFATPNIRRGGKPLLVNPLDEPGPFHKPVRPVHPLSVGGQDFWFGSLQSKGFDLESLLAEQKEVLAAVFDTNVALTDIPVVGGAVPPELGISLRSVALIRSPAGVAVWPELWVANKPFMLPFLMLSQDDPFAAESGPTRSASAIRPVFWADINTMLGPVDLHRLGLGFGDKKLWLLMDVSLQLGQMKMTALGLGFGLDLPKLFAGEWATPAFNLDGLGLELRTAGGTTVGGALLRRVCTTVVNGQNVDYDGYAGAVIIQTNAMSFSALGSFQAPPGQAPSFFAYGSRNEPLGGPPFFFVTRLSLGLGVNMRFRLPDVDKAGQFPLVRDAVSMALPRAPSLADLIRVAGDLQDYQENAPGTVVLAAGVLGTSFGLINTSMVLLATIGASFEVDLIGQSVLKLPADALLQRIADIRVNWRGHWTPSADKISIRGQVQQGSWAFHTRFKLTGQMALEAWTKGPHAGDFVLTIGGYAPSFSKPAHYPSANRLAFGWCEKVGGFSLSVKGEGYCAITPAALMVGGGLRYSLSCGDFDAWYTLEAHCMLQWYPFRYLLDLSLSIGASYEFDFGFFSQTIEVEVGASVKLWGPDLGGEVSFKLVICKVSFSFGASDAKSAPLTWAKFKSNFLPAAPLAISARSGLREEKAGAWVVDADELVIDVSSAIPAKSIATVASTMEYGADFGVRPMEGASVTTSDLVIEVVDKKTGIAVPCSVFEASRRSLPAAQWGLKTLPKKKRLVDDLLTGVSLGQIGGVPTVSATRTVPVPVNMVNGDMHTQCPGNWQSDLGATNNSGDYATIRAQAEATAAHTALLRELYDLASDAPDPKNEVRSRWIDELQETPNLKTKRVA